MRHALLAGALLFAALDARPARACSPPPAASTRTVELDGRTGVPINAEIRLAYQAAAMPQMFVVRPAGGDPVAIVRETLPLHRGYLVTLRPTEALAPATTYEVLDDLMVPCAYSDECSHGFPMVVATFTTRAGPDTTVPEFAGLHPGAVEGSLHAEEQEACWPYEVSAVIFGLSWDAASDDTTFGLKYSIERNGERIALVDGPTGATGLKWCQFGDWFVVDADFVGDQGLYTVHAVDVAGNLDASYEMVEVALSCGGGGGGGGGGGCSTAPGAASSTGTAATVLVLVLVLLLLALVSGSAPARRTCTTSSPERSGVKGGDRSGDAGAHLMVRVSDASEDGK